MSGGPGEVVPLRFDLSDLVRRSVASLYSHLVTRPTGQALRLGIESQIGELGALCLSVLDFEQVAVLDYSCADETIAKLILRYQQPDRPVDAYFLVRGVGEHHCETIEAVLNRHGLALVADVCDAGAMLLGEVAELEHRAWRALDALARASAAEVAAHLSAPEDAVERALHALADRRVVLRHPGSGTFVSLRSLLSLG